MHSGLVLHQDNKSAVHLAHGIVGVGSGCFTFVLGGEDVGLLGRSFPFAMLSKR